MQAGAWPDASSTLTWAHGNVTAIKIPRVLCCLHNALLACCPAEAVMMTEGGRLVISHLFSQKAGPRHGLLATDAIRTGTHRLPDMLRGTVGLIGGGSPIVCLSPFFSLSFSQRHLLASQSGSQIILGTCHVESVAELAASWCSLYIFL